MAETYYKPCSEFDRCNELIEKYWNTKQFEKCFEGHMELAEKGYPLAECQPVITACGSILVPSPISTFSPITASSGLLFL